MEATRTVAAVVVAAVASGMYAVWRYRFGNSGDDVPEPHTRQQFA